MTLIGQDILTHAGKRNKPLRSWLTVWAATVAAAQWHGIRNLRNMYPSADGVSASSGLIVTVFNVKGNRWRLLTWIDFDAQSVEVLEVLAHAEYSKNSW